MRPVRWIVSLLKNTRAQSLTEFALILPFVLVLIGGVVDFGLIFFISNVIENAAREGARMGAVQQVAPVSESGTFPACRTSSSTVLSRACLAIPNVSLFSGFTVANSGVTGATPNKAITIQVSGTYKWYLIPGMMSLLKVSFSNSALSITRSSTMRWEWQT